MRSGRIVVLGSGYVGLSLAKFLAANGWVVAVTRLPVHISSQRLSTVSDLPPAINVLPFDITSKALSDFLPHPLDVVVNTIATRGGDVDAYRAVYLEGVEALFAKFKAAPPKRYIHLGSTSVYGQTDGGSVDESSPRNPSSVTSQILVSTEDLILRQSHDAALQSVILRSAGIYGPGRGHLFQKFLRGEASLTGDGGRYLNMIHLEDLVAAIVAAIESPRLASVYNVCDDLPVTEFEFYHWLSEQLRLPMPPGPASPANSRKRGLTSKRVSNSRIKADLGLQLRYPTFRHGYCAAIDAAVKSAIGATTVAPSA